VTPVETEERAFERELRTRIMQEIESLGLSAEDVAQRTGMLPSGVDALFQRRSWPLPVAFRVARGLDLEIRPSLDRR
jgi:ribosome-binding protein aMBF1 (putative translation factor)